MRVSIVIMIAVRRLLVSADAPESVSEAGLVVSGIAVSSGVTPVMNIDN